MVLWKSNYLHAKEKKKNSYLYKGGPKKSQNLLIKMCTYSYMFKLPSPSKCPPCDAMHLSRYFFHCSKLWNLSILMPFSASTVFCFTSSTSAKCFPLRLFFMKGNKREVVQGEIRWIGRVGHAGYCQFLVKHSWTQRGVGRYAPKSPVMKWANALKESSKKFTEAEHSLSQQCQLVFWYRSVPGTFT